MMIFYFEIKEEIENFIHVN